jgi:hypothetical protein
MVKFPAKLFKQRQIRGLTKRPAGIASGCLIAVIVLIVLLVGAGVYVAKNFKNWAADGVAVAMALVIEESALPPEEKSEIILILDQLKEDFQVGDITLDELGLIFQAMENCPALTMGMTSQFEASYLEPSGLNDQEKIEASLALNRLAQGLSSGSISWEEASGITTPISVTDQEGHTTIKEPGEVTDDEIRQAIAIAKRAADDAGIAEEKIEIDISDEFLKTIKQAIGRSLW